MSLSYPLSFSKEAEMTKLVVDAIRQVQKGQEVLLHNQISQGTKKWDNFTDQGVIDLQGGGGGGGGF